MSGRTSLSPNPLTESASKNESNDDKIRGNDWATKFFNLHEYTNILLDSMPFCLHLWDRNLQMFACNEASMDFFKLRNKQELFDNFLSFSPEYQPDGQRSDEKAAVNMKRALEKGKITVEWMHQASDGTPLPTEITLVRVRYEGADFLASYIRDLRQHKQLLREIEEREKLMKTMMCSLRASATQLEAIVTNYSGLIWSVNQNRVITFYKGTLLKKLGKKSSQIEGQTLDAYFDKDKHHRLLENIQKTFTDGAQDWLADINGRSYHIRTTPIADDSGRVTDVVGSFDDVTELSWLQTELKNALKAAQDANRAKDNFLARMSHEMRTPLNVIIGLSELVLENYKLNKQCQADLEQVSNAGTTLLNLVNDLLDIAKIEVGKSELVGAEYDLPSLINDAITQSILYMGEKPIRFILDIDESLLMRLYGDEQRVRQILNNLLSNAFKYTREGVVELGVHCVREGDAVWMTIQVSDTGIGIQPEDMDWLFTDYIQLHTQKMEGGTGLGLPIVKRMVEMMGGSITVKSKYKEGSIFTARLRQDFVTDATIGPEMANSLKTFRYVDHRRRLRSRLSRLDLSYARVLVVDDMPANLDVTKGMMMFYGVQVDCVTSGQQAIDAIRAEKVRYDAVFMDHMMPEMNGMEATRIIRENIGTAYARTIPIIALTANAVRGSEEMFLNNGFQAFLSKPIDRNRLDALLQKWVRNKEREKALAAQEGMLRRIRRQNKERRALPTRRSGTDRRLLGENIAGLHMSKGLRRFGGDEGSFLHVLRSFAANTRPLLEKIKKVRPECLADYAIVVHGIKGASRGICAEMIGDQAEALEQAAKAGDFDFVRANNPAFLAAAKRLVADIDKLFAKMAEKKAKPKKDRPDGETLEKLFIACKNNDMDDVDAAMSELEGYEYALDDGLIAWLRQNVDQMNFTEIQDKLAALSR